MYKKKYLKPKLTVVVRESEKESVLDGCKTTGHNYPSGSWTDCWTSPGILCSGISDS